MTEKKRQPRRTVEVNYYDPTTGDLIATDLIAAAPFVKWNAIAELQKPILELYVETGTGAIGDLFCNEKFISLCRQLAVLIPVVGQKRSINFDALIEADDWPQITRLFVTTSYDEAGNRELDKDGTPALVKPGLIADLHNLNFLQIVIEMEKTRQKRLEKELTESEAVEATK